jgi:hypothetical protein
MECSGKLDIALNFFNYRIATLTAILPTQAEPLGWSLKYGSLKKRLIE